MIAKKNVVDVFYLISKFAINLRRVVRRLLLQISDLQGDLAEQRAVQSENRMAGEGAVCGQLETAPRAVRGPCGSGGGKRGVLGRWKHRPGWSHMPVGLHRWGDLLRVMPLSSWRKGDTSRPGR